MYIVTFTTCEGYTHQMDYPPILKSRHQAIIYNLKSGSNTFHYGKEFCMPGNYHSYIVNKTVASYTEPLHCCMKHYIYSKQMQFYPILKSPPLIRVQYPSYPHKATDYKATSEIIRK